MSFRLREDAEKWFSEIAKQPPFRAMFDMYYFCLVLGLATGRLDKEGASSETIELVDYFIEDYKAAQRCLMGMLILAELKRQNVSLNEKKRVQEIIHSLIDPNSHSNLTQFGFQQSNAYASGGYDYLFEKRAQKPYGAGQFLRDYKRLIDEALSLEPFWKKETD